MPIPSNARFSLPQATTGRWLGLNPWLHPLPIPVYVSLVFPAGNYEIAFNGVDAQWRYLGPHFSTIGTHKVQGNMIIPVGYKGEYCFAGDWVPGGIPLGPPLPSLVAEQQATYGQMFDALQRKNIGRLLALMIKRRGL